MTAIFILAGCATTPPPLEQLAVSKAAIVNAKSAGANELAPQEFKLANDKIIRADQAMEEKNFLLAQQLAEQAQLDAQLSIAVARSTKAKQAADTVYDDSRVLQKEIIRNTR
ncbi:MAG: DUF4398 domain-containing protein [Gallionellaceae bacterium]